MAPSGREEKRRLSTYPLYGTTFVIHRASPLYIGVNNTLLNHVHLPEHARRLRDILKGHVLRGVHIYSETDRDGGLEKVGGLRDCRWTVLDNEQAWAEVRKQQLVDEEIGGTPRAGPVVADASKGKGILVEIEYEKITYQAMLLCDPQPAATEPEDGFMHLPLLLTRMPGALRTTFLEYLSTTFDTRISQMKLPTEFLPTVLERFFADLTADQDRLQRSETIKSIVGDVQITFKFSESVTPTLKTFDFDITKADLPLFLSTGQKLLEKSQPSALTAGQKRKRDTIEMSRHDYGPFLTALSSFLTSHLGLDISQPGISIWKVACGAFVLGAEGKIKLFPPARGARDDVNNDENDEEVSPSISRTAMRNLMILITEGAKSRRALREVSRNRRNERQGVESGTFEHVDVDLPPPYELHDPSRATMV